MKKNPPQKAVKGLLNTLWAMRSSLQSPMRNLNRVLQCQPILNKERLNLASLVEDIQAVPFDKVAGIAYGPIRVATRESKQDHLDKLIAAHAVSLNIKIVTNNLKYFARLPNLVLENWVN